MKDHGIEFENNIEDLMNLRFLEDIVVRSPKVVFGIGKPEELADMVLVLDNTLYAFQCKSRKIDKHPDDLNEIDHGRIAGRVHEAFGQLKTIRRAIQQGIDLNLVNARGIRIHFTPSSETKLVGVVLLNIHGEQHLPFDQRVQVYSSVIIEDDVPVHLFKSEDFWYIASFNDTPADFAEYLETHLRLHARGVIFPFTRELDYLVLYKCRYPVIRDALNGKTSGIGVEDGFALKFFSVHKAELQTRQEHLQPSYLIDLIIKDTHKSIGFNPVSELPPNHELINEIAALGQGSEDFYFSIATELSKLRRTERLALATALLEKAKKADNEGYGYKLCMFDKSKHTAYLVYCHKGDRAARLQRLRGLCEYACVQSGADKLVGIATEPASSAGHSYDFVLLNKADIPLQERIKLMTPLFFKSPSSINIQEWK